MYSFQKKVTNVLEELKEKLKKLVLILLIVNCRNYIGLLDVVTLQKNSLTIVSKKKIYISLI